MNTSKLINILRTFSKSEMKEFEKLVSSPFFNRGRNHVPFLKQLKKFHPRFDDETMTQEYIYSKINPGKEFNKQVMWNMTSALLDMAEEFLIQVTLKKNSFIRNSHIEDELYYRKLTGLGTNKLELMDRNLKSIGLGSNYFYYSVQMEIRRMNLLFLEDKQQLIPGHVVREGEYVVLYFIIILSNVIINMNYHMLLFNSKFEVNIPHEFISSVNFERVIQYAKSKKYKYTYVLEMYYSLLMTAIKPSETDYFLKAKELFEKHSRQFEPAEFDICLGVLCNYCVFKVNHGEEFFIRMLFEVNLLQLKKIEEARKIELGKTFYVQALRNALLINETEWVKKFIEKYTPYLKTTYQKPMKRLADAFLAFHLRDYNKVIENLGQVRFFDIRDKFYVKSLSLRAYYELNEIITLIYNIDSAKQFVKKNPDLGRMTRNNFSKFLKALKKLVEFKEKGDLYDLEKLYKEIEQDRGIINHNWLLEKIEELKKGAV